MGMDDITSLQIDVVKLMMILKHWDVVVMSVLEKPMKKLILHSGQDLDSMCTKTWGHSLKEDKKILNSFTEHHPSYMLNETRVLWKK